MASKKETKKETGLSISVKKEEDLSKWYADVLVKSEAIEYYNDVSGCYILRPWSFLIWEAITDFLKSEAYRMGAQPCYFPMFVTKAALNKEEDHVEDFEPEVAWVTRSGKTDLAVPIALRPTSECVMYGSYSKWIRSHRDLPLKLFQMCNVVRWEFKAPTPFLRTREFLWEEGHTAFATKEEADEEVLEALDVYGRVYEELMAVPVIKGRKSHKEKFAGGDFTTTVEAFIPAAGRSIQGATSHSLGQNFAKMFDITFLDEDGASKTCWQNSWGITTRTLGVMVMVHGDNKGLVLPPRIAPHQVVVINVVASKDDPEKIKALEARTETMVKELRAAGVRVNWDRSTGKTAGFKYNHWEQKGVPIRVELGMRDFEAQTVVLARRDTGEKQTAPLDSDLPDLVQDLLTRIQADMLQKARNERDNRITVAWTWPEFLAGLAKQNMVLAPWCCTTATEDWVKEQTSPDAQQEALDAANEEGIPMAAAKTLCIPFNQPPLPEGTPCFTGQGGVALSWCLWGRSF